METKPYLKPSYLPIYLCDSSDSSDYSDSSDSSDSTLKNINFDKTQKLKLWWNSTTQIVIKLKKINCDETQKPK